MGPLDLSAAPARLHAQYVQRKIVILGGGTGGTLTANRLRRAHDPADVAITVIDQDNRHLYQPGLLFVPFGLADPDEIVRPRGAQLHHGVEYLQSAIERVDIDANEVALVDGNTVPYDVLVVATGAVLLPEETEGLTGPGWMSKVFTFYDLDGAMALADALKWFDGGQIVVNVVDMPIKCPVAPLEFCFLADWYFHERGIRNKVDITYVTPLDGVHQARRCPSAGRPARRQGHQVGDRVQHRRGGRRRRSPRELRRPRSALRSRGGRATARRRALCRTVTRIG